MGDINIHQRRLQKAAEVDGGCHQLLLRGLPFSTYAPRGGGGQAYYTFPLRITCKKGVGGSR